MIQLNRQLDPNPKVTIAKIRTFILLYRINGFEIRRALRRWPRTRLLKVPCKQTRNRTRSPSCLQFPRKHEFASTRCFRQHERWWLYSLLKSDFSRLFADSWIIWLPNYLRLKFLDSYPLDRFKRMSTMALHLDCLCVVLQLTIGW